MSSIVKKSSHFVPKVKKRVPRNNKAAQLTPPTTQDTGASPDPTQITQPDEAPISTPPTTQVPGGRTDLSKYEIATPSAKDTEEQEDEADLIDPKDTSRVANEQAIQDEDSDGHEYGDNDIFKKTLAENQELQKTQRRRSSVASRRLSGIFNRSGSVSTPGSVGPDGEEAQAAPVKIGIPTAKPSKRSRLSISRASKRQRSTAAVPDQTLVEEDETASVAAKENGKSDEGTKLLGPDFVVGLDPATNKFVKYRAHEGVDGTLPVAPADLVTTVTDIRQLPRKIKAKDEALFALLSVLADDMTMAELCKPLVPIGSVSSNFQEAESAKKKLSEKKDIRRRARERAREKRISYEKALEEVLNEKTPAENEETPAENEETPAENETSPTEKEKTPAEKEKPQAEPEVEKTPTTNALGLQIVDGNISVNTETTIRSHNQVFGKGDRQVEYDNSYLNPITSNSYTKLGYTDAWTSDELTQFYNALSTWGTDFTFIAQLFPYRNRRQIKRKFTLEEKKRPELVELALRRQLPPNIEAYCAAAADGKNFKTLKQFDEEIQQLRDDHEKHINEIQSEREKAIKEDLEASRKREMELRTGSRIMTRAERERELRKNEVVVGTVDDTKKPTRALKGES